MEIKTTLGSAEASSSRLQAGNAAITENRVQYDTESNINAVINGKDTYKKGTNVIRSFKECIQNDVSSVRSIGEDFMAVDNYLSSSLDFSGGK